MARRVRRRRIALLAFVITSGAAHALVGAWLFGHRDSHPHDSAASTRSVQVVPVPVDGQAKSVQPDTSHLVEAPPPTPGAPAQASSGTQANTRYFDASELDQEAQPLPDWAIDAPGLYSVGLRRAVMQIFVSDAGEAVRCVLESAEPDTLTSLVKAPLERQVCSTLLSPALREGRTVASVRRIELLIAP